MFSLRNQFPCRYLCLFSVYLLPAAVLSLRCCLRQPFVFFIGHYYRAIVKSHFHTRSIFHDGIGFNHTARLPIVAKYPIPCLQCSHRFPTIGSRNKGIYVHSFPTSLASRQQAYLCGGRVECLLFLVRCIAEHPEQFTAKLVVGVP